MYYFSDLLATVAIRIIHVVNPGPNRSSVSESKIFF